MLEAQTNIHIKQKFKLNKYRGPLIPNIKESFKKDYH